MELEQAKEIIGKEFFEEDSLAFTRNSGGWSSYDGDGTICLDGYYDIEDLEAFITIMKNSV